MNTDVMFSSKTDLWETPQTFFDKLNQEFGFTLDACAVPDNAKCERYYTPEQDGLSQPWDGVVWCNPPYGREVGKWVRRGLMASERGMGNLQPHNQQIHNAAARRHKVLPHVRRTHDGRSRGDGAGEIGGAERWLISTRK